MSHARRARLVPRPGRIARRPSLPALLVALACGAGALGLAAQEQRRNVIPPPGVAAVRVLSQNWTDAEAQAFYNVPQGSHLIPFSWFVFLEQAQGTTPFRDADHVRALGYIPRTPEAPGNPYGLPVGFVKDGEFLGLTCAACHTNLVEYRGKAWLVDGAPTLGDVARFQRELLDAMAATLDDEAKFGRFAANVLGSRAGDAAARATLAEDLRRVLEFRRGYNARNVPPDGATPFGPGRVDALGAILNEVTETFARVENNHAPADAPVSYPFLWDTPQHDRVQWNGAAENKRSILLKPIVGTAEVGALGRNVGEVLGVFGTVDATHEGTLAERRGYPSSANRENLIAIEASLRRLWSPRWPQEVSGIDESLRAPGEVLFRQRCAECHERIDREDPDRAVTAVMRATGTDQRAARNFATRVARSGVLGGRSFMPIGFRKLQDQEPARDLLTHLVERVVVWPPPAHGVLAVAAAAAAGAPERLLAALDAAPQYSVQAEVRVGGQKVLIGAFDRLELAGDRVKAAVSRETLRLRVADRLFQQDRTAADAVARFVAPDGTPADLAAPDGGGVAQQVTPAGTRLTFVEPAEVEYCYKARPLNGIWATAPYLHNGSVPNLDELLKPAARRVKKFRVGSRELDAEKVGFRSDVGEFEFDTTLPGNSNAGHEYGPELSDLERRQLVEYMKSL